MVKWFDTLVCKFILKKMLKVQSLLLESIVWMLCLHIIIIFDVAGTTKMELDKTMDK